MVHFFRNISSKTIDKQPISEQATGQYQQLVTEKTIKQKD